MYNSPYQTRTRISNPNNNYTSNYNKSDTRSKIIKTKPNAHENDNQQQSNINHEEEIPQNYYNDVDLFNNHNQQMLASVPNLRENSSSNQNSNNYQHRSINNKQSKGANYQINKNISGNSQRSCSKSARSRLKTQHSVTTTTLNNYSPTHTPPLSLKTKYSIHHQDKLKVFLKFKPPASSSDINVRYVNQKQVEIQRQTSNKIYCFDHVFHHQTDVEESFNIGCKQLIDQTTKDGKNGLVFVYGHTGTGKTYTMGLLDLINSQSKGIVPQALKYIFNLPLQNITMSFTQIYMDQVYDLLDFQGGDKKMTIRQNQKTKEPYIQNLINISVTSLEEAYQLINIGLQKRKVAEQKINKRSSRGHGLITINIVCSKKVSKLCFVDLAGSQRIKQSDSTGVTLHQAVHINSSLSALQTLLTTIHEKSVRSYRGNKLTRLLQPFIQTGKIRLFVTSNYENIQPIQFAKRCKGIKFMQKQTEPATPRVNLKKSSQTHKRQLGQLKQKIDKLETMNKNLFHCLSNSLGIFLKINTYLWDLLDLQHIHSNFSLSENLSIKNQILENKTNYKINQMEIKQQEFVSKVITSPTYNSIIQIKDIISLINQPSQFSKKIHNIGIDVFNTAKQLSNLSEYRNIYKKQVFISELKTNILENKNQQFENAINYLLKNQSANIQNKLTKELRDMGIVIQKGITKNLPIATVKSTNTKNNNTNQVDIVQKRIDSNITNKSTHAPRAPIKTSTPLKKSRVNTENSPLNKQYKRSEIFIQDF